MTKQERRDLPDFNELYSRFERLSTGARADLRRLGEPDGVWRVPGSYRLLPPDQPMSNQWQRIIFMLPYARAAEPGSEPASLGRQMAEAGVSEMRLFQVVRSEDPNDLIQLRRLLRQVEPRVDWREFGRTLYFWGDLSKRRLAEQYFLAIRDKERPKNAVDDTTIDTEEEAQ